jgi:hypothetical protein
MKTKKCLAFHQTPVIHSVQPKVNNVENIKALLNNSSEEDKEQIFKYLQDMLTPEPEPENDDTNSIQQLRTRLHKQLGEDFLLNMNLPDVEDDEYDIQEKLEDKALDMMSEEFGDDEANKLWEQFNKIAEWNNRVRREEVSNQYDVETFERNTGNHTAPKALMYRKNLTTVEDQYQFWIKKDPQNWYDKFKSGQLSKKISDATVKSKLVEYDYYAVLRQIHISSKQRRERSIKLEKQVQQILKDNPGMKCLCK